MSESSNSAWPFGEISDKEGLDIAAIFKDSADTVDQGEIMYNKLRKLKRA